MSNSPADRPLCSHCERFVAKRQRDICSGCYNRGVRMSQRRARAQGGQPIELTRPKHLADTGLRIDNENAELVHPDGTREWPVPGHLLFECWFDPDPKNAGQLRVLRPACNHKGAARAG